MTKATAVLEIKATLPFVRTQLYNKPVAPYIGSFRDECLDADWFLSVVDVGARFRAWSTNICRISRAEMP